jgi:dihydroorotate dehydrogenase (fumarate)
MDLTTKYLGFTLPHPFMPGACPLVDNLDTVKKLEDAGAAAIVMHSLFEEEITEEYRRWDQHVSVHAHQHPEARGGYLPGPELFALGPEEYLEHLARIRRTVNIPVIASLNGTTAGGWLDYARLCKQAGAQALELNVYRVVTDIHETSDSVEQGIMNVLREVKRAVALPVAVKLSPFFTALPHLSQHLAKAGADALILFNRYYQPDIDVEALEVVRRLHLSTTDELPLRLMWLSILHRRVPTALCVSGGVHGSVDAIRALMCGADAVQLVSALMRHGPGYLKTVIAAVKEWMEEHGYDSVEQLRGSMSLEKCPDPAAYERANYIHMLNAPTR